MSGSMIAQFSVQILSTDNITWQGIVTANGKTYNFASEMQLLKWLIKEFPELDIQKSISFKILHGSEKPS